MMCGVFFRQKKAAKTASWGYVHPCMVVLVSLIAMAISSQAYATRICGLEEALSQGGSPAAIRFLDRRYEKMAKEIENSGKKVNPQWRKIQELREKLRTEDMDMDYQEFLKKKRKEMEACFANKKCAKKMDINEFLAFWSEYSVNFSAELQEYLFKNTDKWISNKVSWRTPYFDTLMELPSWFPGTAEIMDLFPRAEINRARGFDYVRDPGARRVGVHKGNHWRLGRNGEKLMLARAERLFEILVEQNNPAPGFKRYLETRGVRPGDEAFSFPKKFQEFYSEFINEFVTTVNDRRNAGRRFRDEVDPKELQEFAENVRKKGFRGALKYYAGKAGSGGKKTLEKARHAALLARAYTEPLHGPTLRLTFFMVRGLILVDTAGCAVNKNCMLRQIFRETVCTFADLFSIENKCYRDKMEEQLGSETVERIDELIEAGDEAVREMNAQADELRQKIQKGGSDDRERVREFLLQMFESEDDVDAAISCLQSARSAKDSGNCIFTEE